MLRAVLFQSPIKVDTRSTLERWAQLNWNNCCVLCRSLAEHLINWIFYPVKNQQRDAYLQSTSHNQLQFSGACSHIRTHSFIHQYHRFAHHSSPSSSSFISQSFCQQQPLSQIMIFIEERLPFNWL